MPSPRRNWLAVALVVVAAFALGVLLRKAGSEGGDAEPAVPVATAVEEKLADRPHEAALAALSAARSQPSTEAELAMLDVAIDGSGLERVVDTGNGEATAALVLGEELVTASDDGMVQVWERATGRPIGKAETVVPLVALAETEASSRFLAAIDRRGDIDLVDVTDPGRPRILPLGTGLSRGERPLTIAFSKESSEIVAIGGGGEILRVDVTTGEASSRSSVWSFRGDLPWDRGAVGPGLTAARFVPDVYEDEEGLLVATPGGAVADLDLLRGQGKTIIGPGIAPGRVLSLDRVSYGEPQLAVGTSEGLVLLGEESFEDKPQPYPGPPVPAVALEKEDLRHGGAEGTAIGTPLERPFSGPPVRRFDAGVHGIAALHPEGKVSVLGPPGVGISMTETEPTPVAGFDSGGRLLVAEGYDPNHIEALQAVRLQPRDSSDEYPEDEVVQTYRPDRDWWPEAEDPEALYLNDVVADGEYVVAGGQDPNGSAVVLVWDAESGEPLHHLALGTGGLSTELPSIVTKVMMLPEKRKMAAYSAAHELIAIWSTETWELEDSVPIGAAGDVSVSPDEATIVAVGLSPAAAEEDYLESDDPTKLSFVDVDEGRVRDEVHAKGISDAAFSPDGSTLAMVDRSGYLRLRSADGREPQGPLVRVGGGVETLAWRPDGGLIAVAFSQGGVALVDPDSGDVSEPLPYESFSPSLGVAWNSEGTLLAALDAIPEEEGEGYEPGSASIWTLDPRALERRMCELAACSSRKAGDSAAESELGDASRLTSIDMVFQEDGDLLAADGDGTKVRIGYLEEEYPSPPAAYDWSSDGLAWSSPGQVSVLLAGEQRPRSWPCACSGVAWDGDEVVSLETGGGRLVRIDPERGELWTVPTHGVPPHLPSLLGIVGDTPVVSAFEKEPDRATPSALFALEPNGKARRLTADAHGSIYLRSPSSSPNSLAFLAGLSGGVCYSTTNVGVVSADASGGIGISFPPSPLGDEPTSIRSLQVAADGEVSAAIAPIGCDDRGYPEDELPLAERYLLAGERWQPTAEEGYDVQSAGGGEVIVESEGPIDPGRLFVQGDDGREELAPHVEGLVGRP